MNICINGTSGFIGSLLVEHLKKVHNVTCIKRVHYNNIDQLVTYVNNADVIINLAGKSINNRFSTKIKNEIYNSRIDTTKFLIHAMSIAVNKPKLLISTSAIGIYDNIHEHTEQSAYFSDGFINMLINDWEKEASHAEQYGVRVIIARLGIVLDRRGGMFAQILPFLDKRINIIIGKSNDYISYISSEDLMSIFSYFIDNENCKGLYNLTSANPVTVKQFYDSLSKRYKTKITVPIPNWFLTLILGEGAKVLTDSKRVFPEKLLNENFHFLKSDIDSIFA